MFRVSVVVGGVCAGGGMPLGAVPALSLCGEVSLKGKYSIITHTNTRQEQHHKRPHEEPPPSLEVAVFL